MAKKDFQYGGWNSYTVQCGTIMTLISPGDCTLHCGVWLWKLESWQWIHQVPCNVIRGSGFMTLNSPGGSTLQYGRWLLDDMPLNSQGGSTLQYGRWLWDDMPSNSPKRPLYWNSTSGFDFDHITTVDMSFCTSLRNFIEIGPPSAEKMTSCLFWRWRISAILYFRDSIMGSLKAQLQLTKLLSFPENHIFAFWHQHPGSWILGVPYWVLWKANVRLSIGRQ